MQYWYTERSAVLYVLITYIPKGWPFALYMDTVSNKYINVIKRSNTGRAKEVITYT